jgi:hypothetical protein
MTAKNIWIFGITTVLVILVIGYILYGLYLMADEDKYGDLVYVKEKVEDGDLILKSNDDNENGKVSFQEIGLIEKSFVGNVYVWDSKNTVKKTLFDWCEKQNAQKVKILRAKRKIDFKKILKVNSNYNYLIKAENFELVTESL